MTRTATFTFNRNGNPVSITLTAFLDSATQEARYIFVNDTTGQVVLRDGLASVMTGVLEGIGQEFPSDQPVVRQALDFVATTQRNLQAPGADQGPATESAGETVDQAATAKDDGAASQAPEAPAQSADPQGNIENDTDALPTNADPSVAPVPVAVAAPGTLPPGATEGFASDGNFRIDIPGIGNTPGPATVLQVVNPNIEAPEPNNNLVSYVYLTTKVVSIFQQGRFTQDIEGVQIFFDLPRQNTQRSDSEADARRRNDVTAQTAPATTQGTVNQTVHTSGVITSGVSYDGQVGAEFSAYQDVIDPESNPPPSREPFTAPGSLFESEGFQDPTADASVAVAPLTTAPPTTGDQSGGAVSIAPASPTAQQSGVVDLQSQLTLARNDLAAFVRLLAETNQRIANRQGDPAANRDLRSLYQSNINRTQQIISDLERRSASSIPSTTTATTATQRGAKEY